MGYNYDDYEREKPAPLRVKMSEAIRRAVVGKMLEVAMDRGWSLTLREAQELADHAVIPCIDTAIARAVEEERERILAFMGDGLSEWHRAALRAPEEKA